MGDNNRSSNSGTTGGIGFAGLLTIVFIVLKLDPGGNLTTGVVEWPWIGWGVSVFCPIVFCFYLIGSLFAIVAGFGLLALCLGGLSKLISKR